MLKDPHNIVEDCKSGDPQAQYDFVELFRSTVTDAVRAVFPAELNAFAIEDVVSEAFLRVFQVVHRWQGGDLQAFVYTIARRKAIDILRGFRLELKSLRHSIQVGPETTSTRGTEDPQHVALQNERAEQVRDALRSLDESYSRVVEMRIWDQLTYPQIAERLGIGSSTARVRFAIALSRLAHQLQTIERDYS